MQIFDSNFPGVSALSQYDTIRTVMSILISAMYLNSKQAHSALPVFQNATDL